MARIRTIKPEFFTSEDVVSLSAYARLLYIALWCEADREGRMQWRPRTFKMRYLPADDIDVDQLCDEIVKAGMVHLYGDGLAYIPAFAKHQHINPRESASSLPDPHASARVTDASASVQALSVTHREEGKGKEGTRTRHASRGDIRQLSEIDPALLADWKSLRDRKKAPITQTAVDGIEREAAKAGMSLADALRMCCERGWTGFKSEWLAGQNGKPATASMFEGVE